MGEEAVSDHIENIKYSLAFNVGGYGSLVLLLLSV